MLLNLNAKILKKLFIALLAGVILSSCQTIGLSPSVVTKRKENGNSVGSHGQTNQNPSGHMTAQSNPSSASQGSGNSNSNLATVNNNVGSVDNPNTLVDDNNVDDIDNLQNAPRPLPEIPKIGIILGPGGAKAYAHIGVLQEFQKNKIPVHSIVGIEMGALAASLYAWRASVNDVEWQMFKLKEDDMIKKSFMSSNKVPEIKVLNSFFKTTFQGLKVEDLKKPFACPALNLNKNQIFVMSKGPLDQLLPYCMPYPPVFKPYQNNISYTRDVKSIAEFLRQRGANYIVLVNVLAGNPLKTPIFDAESTDNLLWAELSNQFSKPNQIVDYTINLNLENYSIIDFSQSQRRDMMKKGSDLSYKSIQNMAKKLGL